MVIISCWGLSPVRVAANAKIGSLVFFWRTLSSSFRCFRYLQIEIEWLNGGGSVLHVTFDRMEMRLGERFSTKKTQFLRHVEMNTQIVQFDDSVNIRNLLDRTLRIWLKWKWCLNRRGTPTFPSAVFFSFFSTSFFEMLLAFVAEDFKFLSIGASFSLTGMPWVSAFDGDWLRFLAEETVTWMELVGWGVEEAKEPDTWDWNIKISSWKDMRGNTCWRVSDWIWCKWVGVGGDWVRFSIVDASVVGVNSTRRARPMIAVRICWIWGDRAWTTLF